jgi:hypothetical protein
MFPYAKNIHQIVSETYQCMVPVVCSVADPDPGSGAFLTPGSGIGFSGSWIPDPNPYFRELTENFLGQKFYESL